jgi:hypothetical protein
LWSEGGEWIRERRDDEEGEGKGSKGKMKEGQGRMKEGEVGKGGVGRRDENGMEGLRRREKGGEREEGG